MRLFDKLLHKGATLFLVGLFSTFTAAGEKTADDVNLLFTSDSYAFLKPCG
jgi:hypothetical protein